VAHRDQHSALFDRIKQVLSVMAKQGSSLSQMTTEEAKMIVPNPKEGDAKQNTKLHQCEILMTEMMQMLLKQHKDPALQKAYSDCFVLLTKHFYD